MDLTATSTTVKGPNSNNYYNYYYINRHCEWTWQRQLLQLLLHQQALWTDLTQHSDNYYYYNIRLTPLLQDNLGEPARER